MPHIIIKTKHLEVYKKEDIARRFRSLEHVLEQNNRPFRFNDPDLECVVDVKDEFDAIYISNKLRLKEVIYVSDDGVSKDLVVIAPKKLRQPPIYIKDMATGKSTSLRQLKKQNRAGSLSKSQIIKMGILAKKELEQAVAEGKLESFVDGNITRVYRSNILEYIKNKRSK